MINLDERGYSLKEGLCGFTWASFASDYHYEWTYLNNSIVIKKEYDGYSFKKYSNVEFTWVILEILRRNNVTIIKKENDINFTNSYVVLSRIFKLFSKNDEKSICITEKELIEKSDNINLFYEKRDASMKTPELKYIVGISKPIIYKDFINIDISLISTISLNEIKEWYLTNKNSILKMVEEKCINKTKIPLNYYKLGAVTLVSGGILKVVLELKIKED